MRKKKVLVLSLVLVLAVTLIGAGVALAQENQEAKENPFKTLQQLFITNLAKALGTDEATLKEAAKNAANETLDEAAQQGLIPAEKAEKLKEAIANNDWPLCFLGFRGKGAPGEPGFHGGKPFGHMEKIADILGMTPQELRDALESGKTLSGIAAEKGFTLEQLKEKLVAEVKAELDAAVSAGKLSAEKAQEMLSRLENLDLTKFPTKLGGPRQGR